MLHGGVWAWNGPEARRLLEDTGFVDVAVFYDDVMGWKGGMSLRGVKRPSNGPGQRVVQRGRVSRGTRLAVEAAARVGVRPSTAKRHLTDLRARSGLTSGQLIYAARAAGSLAVPRLGPN